MYTTRQRSTALKIDNMIEKYLLGNYPGLFCTFRSIYSKLLSDNYKISYFIDLHKKTGCIDVMCEIEGLYTENFVAAVMRMIWKSFTDQRYAMETLIVSTTANLMTNVVAVL